MTKIGARFIRDFINYDSFDPMHSKIVRDQHIMKTPEERDIVMILIYNDTLLHMPAWLIDSQA